MAVAVMVAQGGELQPGTWACALATSEWRQHNLGPPTESIAIPYGCSRMATVVFKFAAVLLLVVAVPSPPKAAAPLGQTDHARSASMEGES